MKYKLLILVNDLDYFISHRLVIAKKALSKGYKVIVGYGSKTKNYYKELEDLKINFVYVNMRRGGINLIEELFSIFNIYLLFCREKPDIVHLVTLKPYLYGGIAARIASVPNVVSAVAGLGSLFSDKGIFPRVILYILKPILKFAFGHSNQIVIFQNLNDKKLLESKKIIKNNNTTLIKGSGVEISRFKPNNKKDSVATVVLASRLIEEKGICEFVEAAKKIKIKFKRVNFILAGAIDKANPNSISSLKIDNWIKNGVVDLIGFANDIPELFSRAHIICLPSYYNEGLPRTLQEAAAAGRPVVTTTNPGCIDGIIHNETGIAVPPKNVDALVEAIEYLLKNPEIGVKMGKKGRELAKKYFDQRLIVDQHMKVYEELLEKNNY